MKHAPIGPLPNVSRLIQGTLGLSGLTQSQATTLLSGVTELGCNAFDTARVYGHGEAQRRLGKWLKTKPREDVFIIDKFGHPFGAQQRLTPEHLTDDLEFSRQHLQTDYIDLCLLHRDNPSEPVEPMIDWLNQQVERGTIRAFGASNWTHQRIAQANAYAKTHGLKGFVASSPQFSLADCLDTWPGCVSISGSQGSSARRWYAQQAMPVLAWSTLAGGYLTGTLELSQLKYAKTYPLKQVGLFYDSPANGARLSRLLQLAEQQGCSAATLALAYVFNTKLNAFATLGCGQVKEFGELTDALDLALDVPTRRWLAQG